MKRTLEQVQALAGRTGNYVWIPEGYMIWTIGTGFNHEEMFIEVHPDHRGKGVGEKLYRLYCDRVKDNPPYYSVFAFVLKNNHAVRRMYQKMGFREQELGWCIYKGDETVLCWIPYEELRSNLGV